VSRVRDEVAAEAMEALEDELVLPKDLEARMLEAAEDASAAGEPERALPSVTPARRASRFAVMAALAAAFAGALVGGAAWLGERQPPAESTVTRDGVDAAESAARAVAAIDWSDREPWQNKMAILEKLREAIDRLGDPAAIGRVAPRYVDGVRRGFLDAGQGALENVLATATGSSALEVRDYLKQYLLLADPNHLENEAEWEVRHFSQTCAEATAAARRLKTDEVRPEIAPHLATLLRLVERGLARGPDLDQGLIVRTRDALAHAEPRRYYEVFVTPLVDAPRDPARSAGPDNLLYPPITLDRVLGDRSDLAGLLRSKNEKSWGTSYEVLGVYTGTARRAVIRSLDEAIDELGKDGWVAADADADRRTREAVERVKGDYDGLYIHEWASFLSDIEVVRPAAGREGAPAFRALASLDSPLFRVLEVVAENTGAVATRGLGLGADDLVAQRFAEIATFLSPSGAASSYRALLATAAEDSELGRRVDRHEAAAEIRALARGKTDEGADLLTSLLVMPFENPR
jgi:type VI protein secretion system component VasK